MSHPLHRRCFWTKLVGDQYRRQHGGIRSVHVVRNDVGDAPIPRFLGQKFPLAIVEDGLCECAPPNGGRGSAGVVPHFAVGNFKGFHFGKTAFEVVQTASRSRQYHFGAFLRQGVYDRHATRGVSQTPIQYREKHPGRHGGKCRCGFVSLKELSAFGGFPVEKNGGRKAFRTWTLSIPMWWQCQTE